MPIAVRNGYRVNIMTLIEVQEAAHAVVRIRDPEFGITVSQVMNYFMIHGLKDVFMKIHECGEIIQKEIIHFNYMRMILLRDPLKKTISIGDLPIGSSTYLWWTSLFEVTEVFSRSEVLKPTRACKSMGDQAASAGINASVLLAAIAGYHLMKVFRSVPSRVWVRVCRSW